VDFRKKDSQFRLGDQPQRAKHWDGGTMPWDQLVTYEGTIDDQEVDLRTLSNGYLQSWILVHHVLLGHEFSHVGQIAEYFYHDSNGEPSNIAFEKAFRVSPEEMGKPLMKRRGTKIDVYTFEFLSTFRDPEFTRSAMAREQVASILETLRAARAK